MKRIVLLAILAVAVADPCGFPPSVDCGCVTDNIQSAADTGAKIVGQCDQARNGILQTFKNSMANWLNILKQSSSKIGQGSGGSKFSVDYTNNNAGGSDSGNYCNGGSNKVDYDSYGGGERSTSVQPKFHFVSNLPSGGSGSYGVQADYGAQNYDNGGSYGTNAKNGAQTYGSGGSYGTNAKNGAQTYGSGGYGTNANNGAQTYGSGGYGTNANNGAQTYGSGGYGTNANNGAQTYGGGGISVTTEGTTDDQSCNDGDTGYDTDENTDDEICVDDDTESNTDENTDDNDTDDYGCTDVNTDKNTDENQTDDCGCTDVNSNTDVNTRVKAGAKQTHGFSFSTGKGGTSVGIKF